MSILNMPARANLTGIALVLVLCLGVTTFAQYQPRTPVGQKTDASIQVTDPSSAQTWKKGERHTIKWASSGIRGSIKIFLETDAGKTVDVIRSTRNSGSYAWTVSNAVAEGTYKLVVASFDGKTRGESTGAITIEPRSLGQVHDVEPAEPASPGGYQPRTPSGGTVATQPAEPAPGTTPTTQPTQVGTVQPQGTVGQLNPVGNPEVGGFIYPDLEIAGVVNRFSGGGGWDQGFYHIDIRNNGADFSGDLLISGRNDRQPMLAEIYEDISIPAGSDTVVRLANFVWPVYNVDSVLCAVNTELYLDQNNEIVELNDNNNSWSGLVYQRERPYLHIPNDNIYMGHRNGQHTRIEQGDVMVPTLRKGDAISSSWRRKEIVVDVWTTVQNCGPTTGNYVFKVWEDYPNDGSNQAALVGESQSYSIGPGETATVEARCTLDMGPFEEHGLVVRILVSGLETGSGEEQTFFQNRMKIAKGFWD